ncbi:hypothetical protein [Paraburkholderia solisilvae]|uniref:Uncharacterized protein n=1 Tax=Paraburkholderia solisilvae TaxID=624376 RepID=A0A6J5E6I0_9BURK|nr:hypothetical protein [Paraburkholderia solisilvae]CAB3761174.1 hypothetical protein LMG29739_03569 [Paraburkholderia solisilvae]
MKALNKTSRTLIATLVAGGALLSATGAFAQTVVYGEPQMIPVGVSINLGWQPDGSYWDGHRRWAHDDYMHHHPHAHDDPHRHDDHRPHHD